MSLRPNIQSPYDVVIVGARVAGAGTALVLARAGLRVLAIDKTAQGSDTTSTHAIMRPGVLQLHRWGVLDRVVSAATPPIRRTTFHYRSSRGTEVIPVDIRPKDGVDALFAPRRTLLDSVLVDAAREAGAEIRHEVLVDRILQDGSGPVTGVRCMDRDGRIVRVESRLVIGADGIRSRVARSVGAATLRTADRPGAFVYGYFRGLELDGTNWYYAPDASAGAIPTNDGLACVFVGMPPKAFGRHRAIGIDRLFAETVRDASPDLARRMGRAELVGKLHPFPGLPGYLRQGWGPGWALVGDAGFFRDPLTAHGMTDALRDAELLARAVIAGGPDAMNAYQAARDAHAVSFLELSDDVGSYDWGIPELKAMHYRLSQLMGREYDTIRALDTAETAGTSAVAGARGIAASSVTSGPPADAASAVPVR